MSIVQTVRSTLKSVSSAIGLYRVRPLSPARTRLLAKARASVLALEIGPFVRPVLRGPNIRYFDVLTKEEMIARAAIFGDPAKMAVDIDYLSRTADLSIIPDDMFDTVFSSHCIEHQPDLVAHLQQVDRILKAQGTYLLIVPDKRYCFDHFIPETTLEQIVQARSEKRRVHVLQSLIEHRAHITHNDAARHWAGDHGEPAYVSDPDRIARATAEHEGANGGYIDVHAWQFTPASFKAVFSKMRALGLINFEVSDISETEFGALEFYAILTRG